MDPTTLSQYYQNTGAASDDKNQEAKEVLQSGLVDKLNAVDWNKACRYAFRSTYYAIPGHSKNAAFGEVTLWFLRILCCVEYHVCIFGLWFYCPLYGKRDHTLLIIVHLHYHTNTILHSTFLYCILYTILLLHR